jgi:hypothetical protein
VLGPPKTRDLDRPVLISLDAVVPHGIRSERQLMEQVSYNLAMRWYAGDNLDEPLPDHSSLSRICARLGLTIFRRFFETIVEQCIHTGLVWGDELIFDATKVRANASMDSLIPRVRVLTEEHLAQLEPPAPPTARRPKGTSARATGRSVRPIPMPCR